MTATFEQAYNEILDVFKTAWDTTGHPALYPNVVGEKPAVGTPYARITIRHVPAGPASLTGGLGTQRFPREGLLVVRVYIPAGEGLSEGLVLAKVVADAYEGAATPSHVVFRNIRVAEAGANDEWSQINLLAEFTYSEVK